MLVLSALNNPSRPYLSETFPPLEAWRNNGTNETDYLSEDLLRRGLTQNFDWLWLIITRKCKNSSSMRSRTTNSSSSRARSSIRSATTARPPALFLAYLSSPQQDRVKMIHTSPQMYVADTEHIHRTSARNRDIHFTSKCHHLVFFVCPNEMLLRSKNLHTAYRFPLRRPFALHQKKNRGN